MEKSQQVSNFILAKVEKHPSDLVSIVADEFNFSRQRAHHYVSREVDKGHLFQIGKTNSTRYFLVGGKYINFVEKIDEALTEDKIWSKYIKPSIIRLPENIQRICNYGFTEIYNNAIEHSEGTEIVTEMNIGAERITISISDDGIGIFKKIKNALNLDSVNESILHLSKGKFTTSPSNHTGQGIFFTSRSFDVFSIMSDDLFYRFKESEWLLCPEKKSGVSNGTHVEMSISVNAQTSLKTIFNRYSDTDVGFQKTRVAVALSADPGDPHISRSQAKRLLFGLDKFNSIVLDFNGVDSVGQAFTDEVFRVFKNANPEISIYHINANQEVENMITRAKTEL